MTDNSLKIIADAMEEMSINYSLAEWKGKPIYPYFVGEYQEAQSLNEDGMQETTFILTGFSRTSWVELEEVKKKIKRYFNPIGGKIVEDLGDVTAIFYENSMIIPNQDAEIKKIQINLTIKEWSVI